MPTLDFIVQPRIAPAVSLATDAHFLHAANRPSRTRTGVLRVYDFAGDLLSLGRYHLAPPAAPASDADDCRLHRRLSGGRVVPFGDGFVGLTLVLPQRSALFSDDPLALAPAQVMNRYVRGILEACKLADIPAFYPGRDFVTIDRRIVALVSFEVNAGGALLFEAVIAAQRDFSVLPTLLDAVDPTGVVQAGMLTVDHTTCLAEALGTPVTTEEIAALLRRGFEHQFGLTLEPHALTPLELQAIEAAAAHELQHGRWLRHRQVRSDLDRHAFTRAQLGLFETYFSLEQDRFIKDIVFAGDFIANSAAIERLEHDLRLCPVEWRAIDAVASAIFAQPENFILGIGPVRTIAETVTKALAS